MGSPSLLVSQGPPKPAHSVLPLTGPKRTLPVPLSNTANDRFTHCTYWVAPGAPLLSGGAQQSLKLPNPTPTPMKFANEERVGEANVADVCSAASGPPPGVGRMGR